MIPRLSVIASAIRGASHSAPEEVDPYWDNVALLLHCDGVNNSTTFTDEKGKAVSALGNAKISTAQSKFGGASGYFDGAAGSYVQVANSADFTFGSGNFTIEMFFYATATTGASRVLGSRGVSGGGPGTFLLIISTDASIGAYSSSSGMGWNFGAQSPAGAVTANSWNHLALVRNGGTLTLYLNGVNVASDSSLGATSLISTSNPINIGAYIDGGLRFSGYIDEVRITKGVARYTSVFTPPTAPFPNA